MKRFSSFIKSIINACPYSIVGRKCIDVVKGDKKVRQEKVKQDIDTKVVIYKKVIKTGFNIMLIGVLCPFFWYSILSGQSSKVIFMNAIHSGVVVTIGLLIVLINYISLLNHRRKTEK